MSCQLLGEIVKSPADKKDYRSIQLPNGLRVLLISDRHGYVEEEEELEEVDEEVGIEEDEEEEDENDEPDESPQKISAAAMCVEVGGFHEPTSVGGLAHFCEHMLFMGSKKYPDENEFSSFVSKFGGSDNAHTDTTCTVYSFDVSPAKFEQALDMWSQFFIEPLMKKDSVDREMEAVDSEFNNFKTDDSSRKLQIIQECIFKPGHPLRNFMLGNLVSLKEEIKGTTAHDELHKWYPQNYSPKWMNLVLQSPHKLDDLENMAVNMFGLIPETKMDRPKNEPDYSEKAFDSISRLIRYVPIHDTKEIDLLFPLSPQQTHYKIKPTHYLGWLIGHEGKGSLMSLLKKNDWAHEIYAGNGGQGHEDNKFETDFSINIRLTDRGLENWSLVVKVIFEYIYMLKKLPAEEEERIFKEIQTIEKLNWVSKEEKSSYDNVEEIAESMPLFPPEDWLTGNTLIQEYDPAVIRDCLADMRPDNCAIILTSKDFNKLENLKEEKWMGAKYMDEAIPPNLLFDWSNVGKTEVLAVPESNKYLAESTEIKTKEPSRDWKHIRKIVDLPSGELFFKADSQFNLPRGYIILLIRSNVIRRTPKSDSIYDFFPFMLIRLMAEVAYDAETADLHYSFDSDCYGLKIQISGLDNKLSLLYQEVLNQIANFKPSQVEFDSLKAQFLDNYSTYMKIPENYGKDIRLSLMEKTKWDCLSRRKSFEEVTLGDCIDFVREFRENCWLQMQVEGNFYQSEAETLFNDSCDILQVKRSVRDIPIQTMKTPNIPTLIKVQNLNEEDNRSEFISYWQSGPMTIREYAIHDLLISIMEEPCFDFLRTKKTLGYTVFPMCRCTYGVVGSSITVRSQRDKFTVEEVHLYIKQFLKEFKKILKSMKAAEFEEHRNGLIDLKSTEDNKLRQVVARNYSEISSEDYRFDRLDIEIKHLKEIKKNEVLRTFEKFIEKNPSNLIIAVEGSGVQPNNGLENVHLPPGEEFADFSTIENFSEFKENSLFYEVSRLNK